ncbi:hypothetical protein [Falsiroseomonas sp.]|uniref:hypothetical protein n=1 Tax=Falsiroseomonas sp. TaxID=2870721 RepID=UPI0035615890
MTDTTIPRTKLLRLALLGDAAASGAMGVLLAGAAGPLAAPLGLPEGLLRGAGLALLPWAGWLVWLGTSAEIRRAALRAVIAVNLVWVADSLLLLAGAGLFGLAPSGLGIAFVLAQAAAVLGLAGLQATALRRAEARPAQA